MVKSPMRLLGPVLELRQTALACGIQTQVEAEVKDPRGAPLDSFLQTADVLHRYAALRVRQPSHPVIQRLTGLILGQVPPQSPKRRSRVSWMDMERDIERHILVDDTRQPSVKDTTGIAG
jgi:hypothetical protein